MASSSCSVVETRREEARFELGTPGSAAPIHAALAPARIAFPETNPEKTQWTPAQCESWDLIVAMMWRGVL
jgi:hypothetical protein